MDSGRALTEVESASIPFVDSASIVRELGNLKNEVATLKAKVADLEDKKPNKDDNR